jgi:hypothetical protein
MSTRTRISTLSLFAVVLMFVVSSTATAQQASITLRNCNATPAIVQNQQWGLDKTGPASAESGDTVTWKIDVTDLGTTKPTLVINGFVTVTNTGSANATIGNIVANLQRRKVVGKKEYWVSAAADVADATNGDLATSANIVAAASAEKPDLNQTYGAGNYTVSLAQGTFSETAASGSLNFTDADNNTIWGLSPQKALAPGETVNLLYTAEFDNGLLQVGLGESVRLEVIVSFGNSGVRGGSGASAKNIDISGNGSLDADENLVRSVPCRVTMGLPGDTTTCNQEVTLTDTNDTDHISASGTVGYSNYSTDIGGGTGTELFDGAVVPDNVAQMRSLSVDVDGGADGGTITNTADLTGSDASVFVQTGIDPVTFEPIGYFVKICTALDLSDSWAVTVGAAGGDFTADDFCTADQSDVGWGFQGNSPGSSGKLLTDNFSTLYPASNYFQVGSTYRLEADSAGKIQNFLPQTGTSGKLTSNYTITNSGSQTTAAGKLGGEVAALKLNVDFSANNLLTHSAGLTFGDLYYCPSGSDDLKGKKISEILTTAAQVMGGALASPPSGYTYATLDELLQNLNQSFKSGVTNGVNAGCQVSAWANTNLKKTSCAP